MIKTKKVMVEDEVSISVICDVCKKEYRKEDGPLELQEFTHIKFRGGYGSVFGDDVDFAIDVCQHCLKEKLGAYIREVDCD